MADDRRDVERDKTVVDRGDGGSGGVVAAVVGLVVLIVVVLLLMGVFGGDDADNDVVPVPAPTEQGDTNVDVESPDPVAPDDGTTDTQTDTETDTTQ